MECKSRRRAGKVPPTFSPFVLLLLLLLLSFPQVAHLDGGSLAAPQGSDKEEEEERAGCRCTLAAFQLWMIVPLKANWTCFD